MSNIINLLNTSKTDLKIFESAGKVASRLNIKAYLVGGYIRDKLLNSNLKEKISSKDIDITVCGDVTKYSEELAKELNIETIVPFEQFKTVRLIKDELEIEIAQTRKESYYTNSRKPEV